MKDTLLLFMRAITAAHKRGYDVCSYSDLAANDRELALLRKFSRCGFVAADDKMICLNLEQPENEVVYTLYHELGHIAGHADEAGADDWARRMMDTVRKGGEIC